MVRGSGLRAILVLRRAASVLGNRWAAWGASSKRGTVVFGGWEGGRACRACAGASLDGLRCVRLRAGTGVCASQAAGNLREDQDEAERDEDVQQKIRGGGSGSHRDEAQCVACEGKRNETQQQRGDDPEGKLRRERAPHHDGAQSREAKRGKTEAEDGAETGGSLAGPGRGQQQEGRGDRHKRDRGGKAACRDGGSQAQDTGGLRFDRIAYRSDAGSMVHGVRR